MPLRVTRPQREEFYARHQRGETYAEIAACYSVSQECVRYWCRRQRQTGNSQTRYRPASVGLLSRFDPKVRYAILRLRLEHPRWGPNRIRQRLRKRPSVRGLPLPHEASIGRYLHQWPRFRRRPRPRRVIERPDAPTHTHQRWQMDFKLGIALRDGTYVNLYTLRDPFSAVCIGAFVFPAAFAAQRVNRPKWEEVRLSLRTCFAHWGTLPDEIQTDGEAILSHRAGEFPSLFSLWLIGLGIVHRQIRPGKPTDNAEVERCHRTVVDYAIIGNEGISVTELQATLNQAVWELNAELPSRAKDCHGRPPMVAHPEVGEARRPFQPEHELARFDLKRVDEYLSTLTWHRKVGKTGQIGLGGHHHPYSVGRAYAGQELVIRFDPEGRSFVFHSVDAPEVEVARRPARDLDVEDITGLASWPLGPGIQQLPLPLPLLKG